jgi:PPOX class probable F420-dependent enzyme
MPPTGDPSHAQRLAAERNLWLTTVRPDGRPHVTPVWFTFTDGDFWIGTGASSVKVRNLAANPLVAANLEDGNHPLVAEGRAGVVAPPYPEAVVAAFVAKYGWDVSVDEDPDVGQVALVRIEVTRWLLGSPAEPEHR